jgi:hypothetical protein
MPYPKAQSNPTAAPRGTEIEGLQVRVQELPTLRKRTLNIKPAKPPMTRPNRIFRIIKPPMN